jgi:hypothetical protein
VFSSEISEREIRVAAFEEYLDYWRRSCNLRIGGGRFSPRSQDCKKVLDSIFDSENCFAHFAERHRRAGRVLLTARPCCKSAASESEYSAVKGGFQR